METKNPEGWEGGKEVGVGVRVRVGTGIDIEECVNEGGVL